MCCLFFFQHFRDGLSKCVSFPSGSCGTVHQCPRIISRPTPIPLLKNAHNSPEVTVSHRFPMGPIQPNEIFCVKRFVIINYTLVASKGEKERGEVYGTNSTRGNIKRGDFAQRLNYNQESALQYRYNNRFQLCQDIRYCYLKGEP